MKSVQLKELNISMTGKLVRLTYKLLLIKTLHLGSFEKFSNDFIDLNSLKVKGSTFQVICFNFIYLETGSC